MLGDPPVDWDRVSSPRDLAVFSRERDAYPARLIREQVLDRGRRALVIYGAGHLAKLPRQRNAPVTDDPNLEYVSQMLVMRLEQDGISVFNALGAPIDKVAEVQPTASAWVPIRMTLVRNTRLGAAPSQRFHARRRCHSTRRASRRRAHYIRPPIDGDIQSADDRTL